MVSETSIYTREVEILKIIRQPKDSKICGHCCLSMITGKSTKAIIKLIGHEEGTTTKELVNVLKKLKIKSEKRLKVIKDYSELPEKAILKIKYKYTINWHWVVFYKGFIYDPGTIRGGVYKLDKLRSKGKYPKTVKISSYLEIFS